jgi:hypothetical protein
VNEGGEALGVVAEAALKVLANVRGGKVGEREIDSAAVRTEGLLDLADGVFLRNDLRRTIRPDDEQARGIPPLSPNERKASKGAGIAGRDLPRRRLPSFRRRRHLCLESAGPLDARDDAQGLRPVGTIKGQSG